MELQGKYLEGKGNSIIRINIASTSSYFPFKTSFLFLSFFFFFNFPQLTCLFEREVSKSSSIMPYSRVAEAKRFLLCLRVISRRKKA